MSTPKGVFCTPVLPSGRELRKRGLRTTMAVRFRVPDDEAVWACHFNRKPERMTAAEAVAHPDPRGFELFVPWSVAAVRDPRCAARQPGHGRERVRTGVYQRKRLRQAANEG